MPRAVPRAPDAAVPDASGRPEQEELEVIDSLFAPTAAAGPLPEPQDIKALAGIMLPDLRALEEGVSALLGRIDAAGHEWAGSVLGKSLGPWLASGLVAAAAFELALWRVTRNSARTLFITQRREDSTWTWFPGRAQPPWLGNP